MSLNWSLDKVANWEALWVKSPVDGEQDRERLHGVTEALIWTTMMVDLGRVTADNIDEWCWRLAYCESCNRGKFLNEWDEKAQTYKERNFTRAEVERHIGLATNVSTLTRKQWVGKMQRILAREADARVRSQFESKSAA